MRRAIEIAVVILLTCGGIALFYYYSSEAGLALPALSVFLRRAGIRLVSRFLWVLLLPFLPIMWRNWGRELKAEFNDSVRYMGLQAQRLLRESPTPIRALLFVLYAVCAGITAFVLLVLVPIRVQNIPFVGMWLRETAVPYLMRAAAARGVEFHLPRMWQKVPRFIRVPIGRAHWWILWHTADFAVRTRQASARRMAAFLPKKKTHVERNTPHD